MGMRIALCIMAKAAERDDGPRHTRRFGLERFAGRTAAPAGASR
jgi:hypothetical protein